MKTHTGWQGALDRDRVLDLIPHRNPFLFIDRIISSEQGSYACSEWHVPAEHPILIGHFPGNPILPGVLLIELMAQTAACAMGLESEERGLFLLVRVESASFTRQILPGDELRTEAKLTRKLLDFSFFSCECRCKDQKVASASLLVARKQ